MSRLKEIVKSDRFFQWCINLIIIVFVILVIYPVWFVVIASFSDPEAVNTGKVLLVPVGFSLDGYRKVFGFTDLWIGYANTIFYTFFGTLLNLVVTLPCAYALSRKDFKGRNLLMIFFMVTMYINGGLVPKYLNVKSFGLVDTRAFIIIDGALSVYNLIIARTFFVNSIPDELVEATEIDGSNHLNTFVKIILPLSKAIIGVETLYYGVTRWNAYFNPMIYLETESKLPLQVFLKKMLLEANSAASALSGGGAFSSDEIKELLQMIREIDMMKYCIIIVASLPMMILYPRIQKFFEKGVMIGSLKG